MTIYKGMPTKDPDNQLGADQVHAESGFTRAELEGLAKNHSTPAGREAAQRALAELNGPAPAARTVKPTPAARTVAPAVAAKVAPPVKKTLGSIREAAFANLNGELPAPTAEEPEVHTTVHGFPVSSEVAAASMRKKKTTAKVATPAPKSFAEMRTDAFRNMAGELPEPKAEEPEVKTNAWGFPLPSDI